MMMMSRGMALTVTSSWKDGMELHKKYQYYITDVSTASRPRDGLFVFS